MIQRRQTHRVAIRAAGALAVVCTLGVAASAQEKGDGPSSLFLTYKCDPARRAAFHAHMAGPGVARFENWKKDGTIGDYLVLWSSYVNRGKLDMLVRLDFAQYVDTEKWKAIERTSPGGLSPEGLALCAPDTAYLADRISDGASPSRSGPQGSYLYIPYHFEKGIGRVEYKKYFGTYVKPQNDAWIGEKVLDGWAMYVNQHAAGEPWDALLLYQYAGAAGLARRDAVKAGVRARLANDPEWKAVSDSKEGVRTEDQVILMDPIQAR